MILISGDADMYDGAMFSFEGDFLGYLRLENMRVYTAHGSENGSVRKLDDEKIIHAAKRKPINLLLFI